jgi:uncharacterized protein YecA (UPF0149 family)
MIGAQFPDEDFEALSDWLGRRGKGITDIVELEGFLTAVIIGPNTLSPALWLPKIWGRGKKPNFKDLDEANRFARCRPHRSISVVARKYSRRVGIKAPCGV